MFFHLTQATYRKVQELGLARAYNSLSDFRKYCAMLDALAFLPLDQVKEGMAIIRDKIPIDVPESTNLVDYFDKTYVNGTFRQVDVGSQASTSGSHSQVPVVKVRNIPPLFPPPTWNVNEQTLNNNRRNNNICEGWNNRFRNLLGGKSHPSVWVLIEAFQKEQGTVNTKIQQSLLGELHVKPSRKKYVKKQERLRNLCLGLQERETSVLSFLLIHK